MIGYLFGGERVLEKSYRSSCTSFLYATRDSRDLSRAKLKGQALIWGANLLHGGSHQRNPTLTRWSQVTHYYFEDCAYYTPAFSDEALGKLDLRSIVDVQTNDKRPNLYLGRPFPVSDRAPPSLIEWIKERIKRKSVPSDFDPDTYYRLNPDVAAESVDAAFTIKNTVSLKGVPTGCHEATVAEFIRPHCPIFRKIIRTPAAALLNPNARVVESTTFCQSGISRIG